MSVEHLSPLGPSANSARLPNARGPRRRGRWLWIALIATLLLTVVTASAGLYAVDQSYAGRIYPNVSIRGVAVGELSAGEARQAIERRFAPFLAQPVTLTYGERSWTPTLAELGVRLEVDSAVGAALAAGRRNGMYENLREVLAVYQNGLELPLHLTVDQQTMQAYLLARVAEVEQPAVDATLRLNGTTIATAPSATGQQVLVAETLQEITAAIQGLDAQTIALRTRELQPRLSDAAVAEAQAAIAGLLAGPITLTIPGAGEPFVWSLEDLARLVRVERTATPEGDRLAVSVDTEQIRAKVAALADATELQGRHPRLDWNGGNLRIIREGTANRRLDEGQSEELVLAALAAPAEARALELPMREVPPPVTEATLGQLGINELLSVGRSDFSGSAPYRVTNIKAGMRLLHGVLLAPGEEFSFNRTIGSINASNGFVEGYAIIQNRTQLEWGGGICQDSTTMFRAAFWAGLPITERHGHSFYISWYDKFAFEQYGNGPGMDAAIFTGALDLKFVNDTGNWLLIQSYTNGTTAEVRMYGTDDGRKVSLLGPTITDRVPAPTQPVYVAEPSRPRGSPRQSDTARGGMTIEFTRVIERDGQVVERRAFQTKFKPWPDIFEVNPADLGPDGKPLPVPTPTVDPIEAPPVDPNAPAPAAEEGDLNAQPAPEPEPIPEQQPAPEPAPPATGE
ncbi:MAG TPA: VanW family protein, partial [Chloroflexaceae bacterium]|nr:VanW family protein [Chloroflexaceae bacterium]